MASSQQQEQLSWVYNPKTEWNRLFLSFMGKQKILFQLSDSYVAHNVSKDLSRRAFSEISKELLANIE